MPAPLRWPAKWGRKVRCDLHPRGFLSYPEQRFLGSGTHRDCGVSFVRAFGAERTAEFLWNEAGGKLSEFGTPLHEIHLLLEEPHPDQVKSFDDGQRRRV